MIDSDFPEGDEKQKEDTEDSDSSIKMKLKLGDVIQIHDPRNDNLNEQTFFIDYIDANKVMLINTDTLEKQPIRIHSDGSLGDGTITSIDILYRNELEGYAKQHNLLPDTWVDIHFTGADVFTGQITNLEHDMIEITRKKKSDIDVIYINFDYKGFPENLPIDYIQIRVEPILNLEELVQPTVDDIADIEEKEQEQEQEQEEEKEKRAVTKLRELHIASDEIIFGDELVGNVVLYTDVSSKYQRFSIDSQITDMVDEMLSVIPNNKRTPRVLNDIHQMVERFKQLRETFSIFDEFGNVNKVNKKSPFYKPLLSGYFDKLNTNLYWILPVVKNIKKIYDVSLDDEREDVIIKETYRDVSEINNLLDSYKSNSAQNKYTTLYSDLNENFTPYDSVNEENKKDSLIDKQVGVDITAILDNQGGDMKSAMFKENNIGESIYATQKYNVGLSKLKLMELTNKTVVAPMTPNDTMTIKSFITLPEPFIRFSKINLPGTNILDRANLNASFPHLWQLFNDKTKIQEILVEVENFDIEFKNDNFANNIKNYILGKHGVGTKDEIYQQFANHITPSTRSIINLMKHYMNDKLSIVDIVSYLEPFLIYTDDITYTQYKEIVLFLDQKISGFNKRFGERSVLFRSLRSKHARSEPILIKELLANREISNDVFHLYNQNSELTKSEFLAKLINTDSMKLYSIALSLQNAPLMIQTELETFFKDEIVDLTDKKKNANADEECASVIVAKFYNSVDELEMDNDKVVFFDKRYDKTNYSMIDEYEADIMRMTRDDFDKHLVTQLEKKYKLTKEDARYLADTLIEGHKRVRDGQYAILFDYDNDVSIVYYIRKNNKWVKTEITINGAINDNETEADILCNIQEKCMSVPGKLDNTCDAVSNQQVDKKNKFIKDILSEFDAKYTLTKKQSEEVIKKRYQYLLSRMVSLTNIHRNNMLKYNKQKYALGSKIDETLQTAHLSPFVQIRDLILSQTDFTKKQTDIVRFCAAYTRPAGSFDEIGPLNEVESIWWLYCNKTNTKLIPKFKLDLAHTFLNNKDNYNIMVEGLKKSIGKLSDDGNQWVDEHSGWPITNIEFDTDEGYDESGFKIVTNEVLEDDFEITFAKETAAVVYTSAESKMISNIVLAVSQNMEINLYSQIEFIVNTVTSVLTTFEKESTYKIKIKQAEEKGESIKSYQDYYNSYLLYYTLGTLLIAIQTSIPSIRTRKTYPGCVRSFSGYPFVDNDDYSSLNYLACVVIAMRSKQAPWNMIRRKKKETTDDAFKSDIAGQIKTVIDNKLLKLQDVVRKMNEKTEYLLLHRQSDIPDEYNVQGWKGFMPPLVRIKINGLESISSDFEKKLLGELKSGDSHQREKILIIQSKIILFSLAIQEKIETILLKKAILLKRSNNEPYLENACCDDGKNGENAIDYFVKDDSSISAYNNAVSKLVNLMSDISRYSTATTLAVNGILKNKVSSDNSDFDERTIYLGFIQFCNFKTLVPIPDDIKSICKEKPLEGSINYTGNLKEVINQLNSAGKKYTNDDFVRLLQLISRKHPIAIGTDRPLESSIQRFKKVIENENDAEEEEEESETIKLLKPLVKELDEALDTFDVAEENVSEETSQLRNFLGRNIDKMKKEIVAFINENLEQTINKKYKNNVAEFIGTLENWSSDTSTRNQENKISTDSMYTYVNFFQNFVRNFVDVFPNIILHKTDYTSTQIQDYWNLSSSHIKDVKKMISDYYKDLVQFYDTKILTNVLDNISEKSKMLVKLVNSTPSFSTIRKSDGTKLTHVFDEITSKYFFQYYLLKVFTNYIDLSNDPSMIIFENEDNGDNSSQVDLQKKIAHLLTVFINIMHDHKTKINISYEDILDRIFKEKEKEKYEITDRLKNLSDEQRKVDNMLKKHKLGEWGVGLKKSLVSYDPEEYEKEANKQRRSIGDEEADAQRADGVAADMESNEMHDGNQDDDYDDDYGNDNDDQGLDE
jgi:hypothetical protein